MCLYLCACACVHECTHMHGCVGACGKQSWVLVVFFLSSPPYALGQSLSLSLLHTNRLDWPAKELQGAHTSQGWGCKCMPWLMPQLLTWDWRPSCLHRSLEVKALAHRLDDLSVLTWDPRGRRSEPALAGCSLTSIRTPWHVCTDANTCTCTHSLNKIQ